MFGPVRAVVIDDIPSHLSAISSGFAAAGIPCTPYWYDRKEISLRKKLNPSPPENGHKYLRVIFTDLNLDELPNKSLPETISPAITVIQQLVSEEGGPYAIVFWTGTSFLIDDIRSELEVRLAALNIPLPIAIDEINKAPFLVLPLDAEELKEADEEASDPRESDLDKHLKLVLRKTFAKVGNLKAEILKVLRKHQLLCMISEWESRTMHAAGESSRNLHSIAGMGASNCKDVTERLSTISALVAREAVGITGAREHPARAYDSAMQDLLIDSFNQSVNYDSYPQLVSDAIGGRINNSLSIPNSNIVSARLNTIFHIDANVEGISATSRGAAVELAVANKNNISFDLNSFCCWDDFFWEPQKSNVDVDLPKVSEALQNLLNHEVGSISGAAVEATSKAIQNIREMRTKEVGEKYDALKERRQKFTDSLRWLMIEAGADCDHAQAKSRSFRYLIAVEVASEFLDDFIYGGNKKRLKNAALRLLGPYQDGDDIFYLLVSLKRFIAWQAPNAQPPIEVAYRLRKVVVDFLLNNYATWSMRPGITEFRP